MRKLIYTLFLGSFTGINAQTGSNPNPVNTSIDMYPKSPEAAALSKFVDIPAGNYTGVADFTIPLYTIEFDGQKIPIELRYTTAGVTVGQIATRVGLGWVLNTGASLSQQVIGTQDWQFPRPVLLSTPFNPVYNNTSYQIAIQALGLDGAGSPRDIQPDIYTYSLVNESGKFVMNAEGTRGIPMPFNQNKITPTNYLNTIGITDVKGFDYVFNKSHLSSKTRNTCVETNPEFDFDDPNYRITKIISPKNEQVSYFYDPYPNIYNVSSSYISSVTTQERVHISGWFPPGPPMWQMFANKCINRTDLHDSPLTEIRFDGGKVLFTYNDKTTSPRLDLDGEIYLTHIKVKNNRDEIIKDFTLNYDYFTALSSVLPDELNKPSLTPYVKGLDKRLKLISVKDNLTNGIYHLEYYESFNGKKLPIRVSNDQDFWGVYNGKDNGKKSISITRYDDVNIISEHVGADKNPNINYGKLGNLKRITYPTGGYSEIEYEADNFDISENPIIVYDYQEDNHSYLANDNTYPSTKTLFTITANSKNKELAFYGRTGTTATIGSCSWNLKKPDGTISSGTSSGVLARNDLPGNYELWINRDENYPTKKCTAEYTFNDVIATPVETLNEQPAGTIRVSKIESVDNNGGKIERQYTYKKPTPNKVLPYTKTSGVNQGEELFLSSSTQKYPLSDNGHYAVEVIVSNNPGWQTSTVRGKAVGYDYVQEYFIDHAAPSNSYRKEYKFENERILQYHDPGTPLNVTWPVGGLDRGMVLEESLFDSAGNQVKMTVNEYQHDGYFNTTYAVNSNAANGGLMGYGLAIVPVRKNSPASSSYEFEHTTFPLVNYWVKEKKITTTEYVNNQTDSLQTVKSVSYSPAYNHTFPTETSTEGSMGETLRTLYQYPHDIAGGTPQYPIIQGLITRNQIANPLITRTYTDNKATSEIQTLYSQFNSGTDAMILPSSIYLKKGENATAADRKITYDAYDVKGNLTQYTMENGIPVSVIWGYNQTQPIAKIEGAGYAAVSPYAAYLVLASDVDNNPAAYNLTAADAEANMISNMDAFRKTPELAAFHITTYSYSPLVGVKSVTPPSGIREYYFYDTAQRLQSVKIKEKDSSGNDVYRIIKEYRYNYQQP